MAYVIRLVSPEGRHHGWLAKNGWDLRPLSLAERFPTAAAAKRTAKSGIYRAEIWSERAAAELMGEQP